MAEQTSTQTPEAVQLQIQDIVSAVQIIDIASSRGGFKGPELEDIGAVRNRLAKFVEAAQKANAEADGGNSSTKDEQADADKESPEK